MQKRRLLSVVFGLLLAFSGYAQSDSEAQPESKGSFFFSGGVYNGFFPNGSVVPIRSFEIKKLFAAMASGNYEFPSGAGKTALGLEFGFSSGSRFGGKGGVDFIPFYFSAAYVYPLFKNLYVGPKLKIGGLGLLSDKWNDVVLMAGARLEAEIRSANFPFGLFVGGGIDIFPLAPQLATLPVIEAGIRFPRGKLKKSSSSGSDKNKQSTGTGTAGSGAGATTGAGAATGTGAGATTGQGAGTGATGTSTTGGAGTAGTGATGTTQGQGTTGGAGTTGTGATGTTQGQGTTGGAAITGTGATGTTQGQGTTGGAGATGTGATGTTQGQSTTGGAGTTGTGATGTSTTGGTAITGTGATGTTQGQGTTGGAGAAGTGATGTTQGQGTTGGAGATGTGATGTTQGQGTTGGAGATGTGATGTTQGQGTTGGAGATGTGATGTTQGQGTTGGAAITGTGAAGTTQGQGTTGGAGATGTGAAIGQGAGTGGTGATQGQGTGIAGSGAGAATGAGPSAPQIMAPGILGGTATVSPAIIGESQAQNRYITLENGKQGILNSIYFEPDTAVLIESYRSILNAVGKQLAADPSLKLLIRAYAANFGTADGRYLVSISRARFSRDFFNTQYGISEARFSSEAYGADRRPVYATADWQSHRCVELILYKD